MHKNFFKKIVSISASGLCLLSGFSAQAAESVKDNSFLIEEAYNQEPGVLQFIQTYQYFERAKEWGYSFTNEIPVTDETHQFSYVIPVMKTVDANGDDQTELGDILLNYRYQLMNTETISIAPRFSLIAPTGDYKKGFGAGTVGFQFNQAVSLTLNEQWSIIGMLVLPMFRMPRMKMETRHLFSDLTSVRA